MASKETLLIPQDEYEKVLVNLKKKGEAYVKAYLIRSGADIVWVESLAKEELYHHALVLKGALKERLPFKKSVAQLEVQKEASGGAMEMFMQMMKSQEADRKERQAKEDREAKTRADEAKARDDQAKALLLLIEKMNEDKKLREEKEETKEKKLKSDAEEKEKKAKEDLEERDKRLKDEIEARDKAHKDLLEKVESNHRSQAEAIRNANRMKEDSKENRFKKAADMLKNSVPKMPEIVTEIPMYFEHVDRIFKSLNVDDDLKVDLLFTYMTQGALRLLNLLDRNEIDTFDKFKIRLLQEFKLSPSKYRDMFQTAEKHPDETWTACATRLFTLHKSYLQSRKVTTFDQLTHLLVADRMKEMLPKGARNFISNKEIEGFMAPYDIARNVDHYQSNYEVDKKAQVFGAKVVKFDKKCKKDSNAVVTSETSQGSVSVGAVSGVAVKCFNCAGPHYRRDCPNTPVSNGQQSGGFRGNFAGGFRTRGGFRGGFGAFRGRGTWGNSRGFNSWRGRGSWRGNDSQGYGQHGSSLANNNGQTAGVNRLLVLDNDVTGDLFDREMELPPDCERLMVMYDREMVNVSSVRCNDDVLLSSPEKVLMRIHGSTVEAIVDSGAQISCVNARLIPDDLLKSKDLKTITLQGAFNDKHVSKIMELPCKLLRDRDKTHVIGNDLYITCAVSEKLASDCLLSLKDYKALRKIANGFIPQVTILTDTKFLLETNESGMNEVDVENVLPMYSCLIPHVADDTDTIDTSHTTALSNSNTTHTVVHDIVPERVHDAGVFGVKGKNDVTNLLNHDVQVDMKTLQGADDSLRTFFRAVQDARSGYYLKDELLFRKTIVSEFEIDQLVIPVVKRQQVMQLSQDSLYAGHYGVKKTSKNSKSFLVA